jgi:hypothetical protein
MSKPILKNRTIPNNAINTELLDKLKLYSKETSIPVSKLLDKSIELFLKSVKKVSIEKELLNDSTEFFKNNTLENIKENDTEFKKIYKRIVSTIK